MTAVHEKSTTVDSSPSNTTPTANTTSSTSTGTTTTISSTQKTSMLSTESPPFNPSGIMRTMLGGGGGSSTGNGNANPTSGTSSVASSPKPSGVRSGSSSPLPNFSHSRNHNSGNNGFSSSGETHSNAVPRHSFKGPDGETLEIRNVWSENVEEEMAIIRELIETHPYVAMDTEFPGVVARPVSETYSPDYHYKSLKCNVDLLKIIQLGLSFADEEGNFAKGCPCWQFNFQFHLGNDMFAQDSIDLLIKSGISFQDHAHRGIDPLHFGELLMVSGLVLEERVKWVTYHSGYDFGYLLNILTTVDLPEEEKSFFETLKLYFPTIYDIKFMTSLLDGHFGGLQKLADDLNCPRIGPEHQAGSDSLLTMSTYFALVKRNFTSTKGDIEDTKYKNELYGYGTNHTVHKNRIHAQSTHGSTPALSTMGGEN